jgi:hypothetical protein
LNSLVAVINYYDVDVEYYETVNFVVFVVVDVASNHELAPLSTKTMTVLLLEFPFFLNLFEFFFIE